MSQQISGLEREIAYFQQYFRDFNDPKYLKEERNYKVEASQKAQQLLACQELADLIGRGQAEEVVKRIRSLFSKTNLCSKQENTVLSNIAVEHYEDFAKGVYELLYGREKWEQRLLSFAQIFQEATGKAASWPHLTYLPFLVLPQEHIFLKPEAMQQAVDLLGFSWVYHYAPDPETYVQLCQLAQMLMKKLALFNPRDMIDIQSFLYVIARPEYWRIMPGRDGQHWPQFRDAERIAAGWEDLGEATAYKDEEAIKNALLSSGTSSRRAPSIAKQIDAFRKMHTGDWVFVYNDNSILAVGEIISDYIYVSEEWPPGSGDYNHHQRQVRWLAGQPKSIKPLPQSLQQKLTRPPTVFDLKFQEATAIVQTLYPELYSILVPPEDLSMSINQLNDYLTAHGFHFPPDLLTTYYLSLQTKPFVLLTGISGTGKTKLAQLFAEWMSPTIEEQITVNEIPEDSDEAFHLEVKPYYLKSGFIIPQNSAYQYFNIPDLHKTTSVKVQLGDTGQIVECSLRHQSHKTGGSYVYFFSKKTVQKWLSENFEVGDTLRFRVIERGNKYKLEKFKPTVQRRMLKHTPRYIFLSVRPDWTDNRGLLGFYNLITRTYQTTDFLRLLVQATMDSAAPHFVILDEMNLAKVEYYFADFLSVMESRYLQEDGEIKQEMLRLHDLPRCVLVQGETAWDEETELAERDMSIICRVRCAGCPLRRGVDEQQWSRGQSDYDEARQAGFNPAHYAPPRLAVPINIYFTGTVNVDETTYMFSPKVLDRANTIEFNEVKLHDYFTRFSVNESSSVDETTRLQFTHNNTFVCLPKRVPELRTAPELEQYRQRLGDLNALLATHTMHFGYRVADEILLYLWHAKALNAPNFTLDAAFDYQIYQKVLPKFHGSQAKLQKPLTELRNFCQNNHCTRSVDKIQQMLNALTTEGFASFA
jgi:5-methylcytosine-specific restriction endonuclease McrBC GTP-binding regulatory subunit McrB